MLIWSKFIQEPKLVPRAGRGIWTLSFCQNLAIVVFTWLLEVEQGSIERSFYPLLLLSIVFFEDQRRKLCVHYSSNGYARQSGNMRGHSEDPEGESAKYWN